MFAGVIACSDGASVWAKVAIATHDVDVAARAERVVCLAEGRVTTEERQR